MQILRILTCYPQRKNLHELWVDLAFDEMIVWLFMIRRS